MNTPRSARKKAEDKDTPPFGAPDTRTCFVFPRDVSDTGLRDGSAAKHAAMHLLKAAEQATVSQSFSLVVCADPQASSVGCLRGLSAFILRHVGTQYTQKVLAGLRLLEYLGGSRMVLSTSMICSVASRTPTHLLRGRVRGLKVRGLLLDNRAIPKTDPTAVETAILRPAESERLRTMLEVCRAAQQLDVPQDPKRADRRAADFIASILGRDREELLQAIGKAALYDSHPQARLAECIYSSVWDWAVRLVNAAWAIGQEAGGAPGITISLTSVPPCQGTDFSAFSSYIAGEATALWVADVLPLSALLGDHPPSMRPSVEELPCLRDTSFAHAASGLFGEAGLCHFLGAGERSAGAVAGFVELIRDGDLAMRRFYGPRTRENLRVRSGEVLVNFDLQAISDATKVDPYGEITVETEYCVWTPYEDISRVGESCSTIIRVLTGLNEHCKMVRGSVVVFHVAYEHDTLTAMGAAAPTIPAPVRLLDAWRDTVKVKELLEYVDELRMGPDPIRVVEMVVGQDAFLRQGDEMHFVPGFLRQLLAVCTDHAVQNEIPNYVQPKWVQPGPRMAHLPKSWTQPKALRVGQQANFATTLTSDFRIKPWGSRTPRGPIVDEADTHYMYVTKRIDSRIKEESAMTGQKFDSTKLFISTNLMRGTDQLVDDSVEIARAVGDRARPLIPDGPASMSPEAAEVMLYQVNVRTHDDTPIGPMVMKCLDKMRAVFKGNMARKRMAELQREHISAAKIQIAYAEWRRCRSAAAQTIQNQYRTQLFSDILRGMKEAKRMLTVETGADDVDKGRTPYPRDTLFIFPIHPTGPQGQRELVKAVTNVVAKTCAIPRDLVSVMQPDRSQQGAGVRVTVPYRVRHHLPMLAEQVGAPGGPWEAVIRDMLELGWRDAKDGPPTRASQMGALNTPRMKKAARAGTGAAAIARQASGAADLGGARGASPARSASPAAAARTPTPQKPRAAALGS